MTVRIRDKGSLTSGVSVLHQPDIDLWSSSAVSGIVPPGEDIFPSPQESFLEMAHFSDQYFAKSESGSSMDDSAYVSQADAGSRGNGQQDILNQSFDQFLCSPALSSVSHAGFQGSQFSLPESASETTGFGAFTTSDTGVYGSPNAFSSPTSLDMQSWSSQTFNGAFVSPLAPTSFFHQPTINPSFANPFYNGNDKSSAQADRSSALKRSQVPRMQLDTTPTILNPSSLTSPTPLSSARPHRPASARSSSAVDLSLSGATEAQYENTNTTFKSRFVDLYDNASRTGLRDMYSLQSPSIKSTSDFKDDELDEESLSLPQSSSGRMVEDAESKMARTHPLYQATPGDDDLYHCPQEGKPGCNHKPTKLKCNYDKYVDSHLRPYKCKIATCEGIQFSSTACLLRHEREAHGMHGHGSKPNLCSFPDCERSIPGNGFPRRYNLYDHMKRVHDYTPSATSPDEVSPTMPSGASGKRPATRKRKSTATSDEVSEKRQKSIAIKAQPVTAVATPATPKPDPRAEEMKLRNEWAQRLSMTQQRLQSLQDPLNMQFYGQLSDDLAAMHKIAQKINELSG